MTEQDPQGIVVHEYERVDVLCTEVRPRDWRPGQPE